MCGFHIFLLVKLKDSPTQATPFFSPSIRMVYGLGDRYDELWVLGGSGAEIGGAPKKRLVRQGRLKYDGKFLSKNKGR